MPFGDGGEVTNPKISQGETAKHSTYFLTMKTNQASFESGNRLYVSTDTTNPAQFAICDSRDHQPNAEQAGVGHSVCIARFYHRKDAELYLQAVSEHAALVAVAAAIKNCDEAVIEFLNANGADGNAIELREALDALALVRGAKAVQS